MDEDAPEEHVSCIMSSRRMDGWMETRQPDQENNNVGY
jgi:hypothetical protein